MPQKGEPHFRGRVYRLGQVLVGQPVALRPTSRDGVWEVVFCQQVLGWVNEQVHHAPRLQGQTEENGAKIAEVPDFTKGKEPKRKSQAAAMDYPLYSP